MAEEKAPAVTEDELLKELEWIQSPVNPGKTYFENFVNHVKRNPFVPIGILATCSVLAIGFRHFYLGNTQKSQKMMRWRVGLQAFTIACLTSGAAYDQYIKKTNKT
ncbi:UNVERIFIED_CONTAM: hypothetical protein PYX00_007690 [Menopon gallinae]